MTGPCQLPAAGAVLFAKSRIPSGKSCNGEQVRALLMISARTAMHFRLPFYFQTIFQTLGVGRVDVCLAP